MTQVSAYVLIQTAVNAMHVSNMVRGVDGVEFAHDVSGPYDVIVKVTADGMDTLGRLVVSHIQTVEGVTRTLTCPVVEL